MNEFKQVGLKELQSAPSVYRSDNMINVCYVDDTMLFAEYQKAIKTLKQILKRKFTLRDLKTPAHFPGLEINWETSSSVDLREG